MKEHSLICERIFRLAKGVQAEALIVTGDSSLTRFADNAVSQNVANVSTEIAVRLQHGGRVAKAVVNQSSPGALEHAVRSAMTALRTQKKDPSLLDMASRLPAAPKASVWDAATAALGPEFRAGVVRDLVKRCRAAGQVACGTVDNGFSVTTLANNRGVFQTHRESFINYAVTVRDGADFGWAEALGHDARSIDFGAVNASACAKAKAARNPADARPGRYTVILEPAATADLLMYMTIYGFGGQFFLEGQSFVSGKLGKKVLSDKITITDDALSGVSAGMPFDYEGVPTAPLTLVEKGVAKGVAHDRKTAKKARTVSNGRSLPQPNSFGPIPRNVVMHGGDSSLEKMIAGTERGILVTQFHYTNLLKPLNVEMTGMTRNGTWLVEDGRIRKPVKNLRLTESMVEAFNRVEAVGSEVKPAASWGRLAAPAVKLRDFNFSSSTKF